MEERVSDAKQYNYQGHCWCCRDFFHRLYVYYLMFWCSWSQRRVAYERRCWSPTFMFGTQEASREWDPEACGNFVPLSGGPQSGRRLCAPIRMIPMIIVLLADVYVFTFAAFCQVAAIIVFVMVLLVTYYSPHLRRALCPTRVGGRSCRRCRCCRCCRCFSCFSCFRCCAPKTFVKDLCVTIQSTSILNYFLMIATFSLGAYMIRYPIAIAFGLAVPVVWMTLDGIVVFEPDQSTERHLALMAIVSVVCIILHVLFQSSPEVRGILATMVVFIFVFREFKGSMTWKEMSLQGPCTACRRFWMLPGRCLSNLIRMWLDYRTWVETTWTRKRVWTFRTCREFMTGGWRYPLAPLFEDVSPCELAHALNCGLLQVGALCVGRYRGKSFVAYRSDYEQLALRVFRMPKERLSGRLHVKLEECRIARQAELALARRINEFSVWSVENLEVPDFHWKHYRHHAIWRMLGGHVSAKDGRISGVLTEMTPTHLAVYLNELMTCLNGQTKRWNESAMQQWIDSLDEAACPLELAALGADIHKQAGRVSEYRTYTDLQAASHSITAKIRQDADRIEDLTHRDGALKTAQGATEVAGGVCVVTGAILAPFTCGASLAVTAVGAGLGAAGAVMGAVDESWAKDVSEANKTAEQELQSPEVMRLTRQLHTVIISMQFVGYTQQVGGEFAGSAAGKRFFDSVEESVREVKTEQEKDEAREGMESLKRVLEQISDSIEAVSKTAEIVKLSLDTIRFYRMFKEAGEVTKEMAKLLSEAVLPKSIPAALKSLALGLGDVAGAAAELADVTSAVVDTGEAILTLGKAGNSISELIDTTCEISEEISELKGAGEAGEAESLEGAATEGGEAAEEAAEEAGTAISEVTSSASVVLGVVAGAVDLVLGGIHMAKGIEELKSDGGKVAEACRRSADGLDQTVSAVRPFWPRPKTP